MGDLLGVNENIDKYKIEHDIWSVRWELVSSSYSFLEMKIAWKNKISYTSHFFLTLFQCQ